MTTSDAIDKLLEFVIPPYAGARLERIAEAKQAIEQLVVEARIDERQFIWELINNIRYQNTTLEKAKSITLERLSALQVEQQLTKEEV